MYDSQIPVAPRGFSRVETVLKFCLHNDAFRLKREPGSFREGFRKRGASALIRDLRIPISMNTWGTVGYGGRLWRSDKIIMRLVQNLTYRYLGVSRVICALLVSSCIVEMRYLRSSSPEDCDILRGLGFSFEEHSIFNQSPSLRLDDGGSCVGNRAMCRGTGGQKMYIKVILPFPAKDHCSCTWRRQ
ncbi:unnamed protein product [Nesidiocoris tenuis]|uniref:Uncharacterized protein n=1 Tax=Nesidiocoris tenuis TaxID=355587 RepID=A0A6H5G3J0_9HEMI|nr:unnamed protein product [Nesidiocoris tenuis]